MTRNMMLGMFILKQIVEFRSIAFGRPYPLSIFLLLSLTLGHSLPGLPHTKLFIEYFSHLSFRLPSGNQLLPALTFSHD